MQLEISLINHSNPDLLEACLASIYSATKNISFSVTVIDNARRTDAVPRLTEKFPLVRWRFNEKCLGFSANHNQVLSRTQAEYVCLLNDDTIVHDGAFESLLDYLDENPTVAMAGPKLLNPDNSPQFSAFRTVTLGFFFVTLFNFPYASVLRNNWIHPAQHLNEPEQVEWLLGACMVVRTSALQEVGFLDEVLSPVANSEDMDWCLRIRKRGMAVVFNPNSTIMHIRGASVWAEDCSARMRLEMYQTCSAYLSKHFGILHGIMLAFFLILSWPWNLGYGLVAWVCGRASCARLAAEYKVGYEQAKIGVQCLLNAAPFRTPKYTTRLRASSLLS